MPTERYVNDYESTVSDGGDGLDASQTTIGLADAIPTGLAGGQWRLLIDSEIILVTSFSGSSISACTRGAEGTTAATHAESAAAKHILTAGAVDSILADRVLTGTYAALPAAASAGRLYLPSDSPYLLRDTGAAWSHFLSGIAKVAPLDDSGFGWTNQGGATVTSERGLVRLYAPATSGDSVRLRSKAYTGAKTFSVVMTGGSTRGNNYGDYGIGFRNSSTGRLIALTRRSPNSWKVFKWNSATSYASTALSATLDGHVAGGYLCLQIEDDATNIYFRASLDGGVSWFLLFSEARTAWVTPDEAYYFALTTVNTQDAYAAIYSWLEE